MEQASEQKKVLIIEDDKNIRELYAVALTNAGIDVLLAENGETGVAIALKEQPSVILIDIEMPVMNGHEALEKIRLDDWGKNAHVIFLTNRSEPEHVAHAVIQKPDDYIVKANTSIKEVINQVRIAMHQE